MWQLSLVSALMLITNCHGKLRESCADLTPSECSFGDEMNLSPKKLIKYFNDRDAEQETFKSIECGRVNWLNTSEEDNHFNEVTWMVNISLQHGQGRCDGSLIHPRVVLTAAHCVAEEDPASMVVFAGQSIPYVRSKFAQQRGVKKVIIHKNFEPQNRRKNFANLILREPFEINENVSIVCLLGLKPSSFMDATLSGGWFMMGAEYAYRARLYYINNRTECRDRLNQNGLSHVPLEEDIQCGEMKPREGKREDTFGDHLSQALSPNYQHYFLIGVLSWNPHNTSSTAPTLWSLLKEDDYQWIEETLRLNGIQF